MNLTVLNSDMLGPESRFSRELTAIFSQKDELVTAEIFHLAEMKLHYCIGCWDCWWKTPGR
jgi:multimeric flavodoxin WrbA